MHDVDEANRFRAIDGYEQEVVDEAQEKAVACVEKRKAALLQVGIE